jgi:signal transduction histidine kinase/ActR/RegA family two-component response regulator
MTTWSKIVDRWKLVPTLAMACAIALLVTGVAIAVYSEHLYETQKAREVGVQAQILAGSVTAALAFDDADAAQEYVAALSANPEIEAAGVYNDHNRLVGRFERPGAPPPPASTRPMSPVLQHNRIVVATPVVQRGARLGLVYLRATTEPAARRLSRFGGIGLLLIMACLVLAVLAAAHAALRRANRELHQRARALEDVNQRLQLQMTEREKAEEALRQSQKMEAIGQLTGGVAHDFNNLLMVASSGLDLLDRTQDPTRRARLKDGIHQALDRGAALTRQLLAFSRPTALKPEVIDLGVQIEGMRALLDGSLREDVRVEIGVEPGLWPVEVDPNQLELAVVNISVNARDAMPNGGLIRIAAINRPAPEPGAADLVELSISDNGEGMTAETVQRVFEPFFTTKEVGRGTGLGLSQVYGFAQASGGDVHIDSRPGAGATVTLALPRSAKALPASRGAGAVRPARGDGVILLVEDDDAVAGAVAAMLQELGYGVVRAASAAAALETLEHRQDFRLVFSDMVMPGEMDGGQLAAEIGRRRPGLPVVLTTGFSAAAAQAAADGLRLVLKPYKIDVLAHELQAALAGSSSSGTGQSRPI